MRDLVLSWKVRFHLTSASAIATVDQDVGSDGKNLPASHAAEDKPWILAGEVVVESARSKIVVASDCHTQKGSKVEVLVRA